jgi:glycerophosphoryl diester phosphodiesterase
MKRTSYLAILLGLACNKPDDAPVPNTEWDLFMSSNAIPTDARALDRMEGVYAVLEGSDMFGSEVALSSTWTREGSDTAYYVSIFCGKDVAYLTGSCKYLDSAMLVNMYWRTLANSGTGQCRLTMTFEQGVQQLWSDEPLTPDAVIMQGVYGSDGNVPDRTIRLAWRRPLNTASSFEVLGHRCGGRNADLLPASENSVEMIRLASRLGATGVEMDVRLTSDGVPIIYHDATLNARSIQPCGLFGPIDAYTYAQLSGLVRLIHGERIPTLREALNTAVFQTPLRVVWIDTKEAGASMALIREIQNEYANAAAAAGRDVRILIGLPDEDQLDAFLALPDHTTIPSLCELSLDEVRNAGSEVWAPRWTLGLQHPEVAAMHAEGRRVFVWTVDEPEYIREYMYDGEFDGMLSNYAPLVAYYHHVRP